MHDPMAVAHEIKYPWREKERLPGLGRYRRSLLTVWHVDPEKDGTDDSCDWFFSHVSKPELELIRYPDGREMSGEITDEMFRQRLIGYRVARWRLANRPRWKHPKWHLHHWRFQLHPWQKFVNEHFSRCSKCGEKMGKATRYGGWSGNAVWHGECADTPKPVATEPVL